MNAPPDNELPQRQNPASGVHVQLGQSNIVLLTINTEKREPWLATIGKLSFDALAAEIVDERELGIRSAVDTVFDRINFTVTFPFLISMAF
jgi:hypothetical protein